MANELVDPRLESLKPVQVDFNPTTETRVIIDKSLIPQGSTRERLPSERGEAKPIRQDSRDLDVRQNEEDDAKYLKTKPAKYWGTELKSIFNRLSPKEQYALSEEFDKLVDMYENTLTRAEEDLKVSLPLAYAVAPYAEFIRDGAGYEDVGAYLASLIEADAYFLSGHENRCYFIHEMMERGGVTANDLTLTARGYIQHREKIKEQKPLFDRINRLEAQVQGQAARPAPQPQAAPDDQLTEEEVDVAEAALDEFFGKTYEDGEPIYPYYPRVADTMSKLWSDRYAEDWDALYHAACRAEGLEAAEDTSAAEFGMAPDGSGRGGSASEEQPVYESPKTEQQTDLDDYVKDIENMLRRKNRI
jgi:hypothetical protein